MMRMVVVFLVIVFSSRMDSLRDRHFGTPRWRRPIVILGTDPWHLVKWAGFYPPLVLLCWIGYGAPWKGWIEAGLWAGTTAAAWAAWGWGSPWPSFWKGLWDRLKEGSPTHPPPAPPSRL